MKQKVEENEFEVCTVCTQEDINYLWNGITEYNHTIGPMSSYSVYEPYRLLLRDENNVIIAGILTKIYLNCMHVELFWIDQAHRKMGLGTKLLAQAEQTAIQKGCTFIYLDTFSFQAIEFYKKLSYEIFAVLNDFPDEIKQYYLKKKLDANDMTEIETKNK
jgi:Acetyltransferases